MPDCPQIYPSSRIIDKICNYFFETCICRLAVVTHEGEQEHIAHNIPFLSFFHVMRISPKNFQIDAAALNALALHYRLRFCVTVDFCSYISLLTASVYN
jgi:hypothetical protein